MLHRAGAPRTLRKQPATQVISGDTLFSEGILCRTPICQTDKIWTTALVVTELVVWGSLPPSQQSSAPLWNLNTPENSLKSSKLREQLSKSPFYKWGDWGPEKWINSKSQHELGSKSQLACRNHKSCNWVHYLQRPGMFILLLLCNYMCMILNMIF